MTYFGDFQYQDGNYAARFVIMWYHLLFRAQILDQKPFNYMILVSTGQGG